MSELEQQKLKEAYRKASRLCHPDKLADAFKIQGTELFKSLSEAYQKQDIARVLDILEHLENGKPFSYGSDTLQNIESLKAKIASLRLRLKEVETEIGTIKESVEYQRIKSIEDRKIYFEKLYQELKEEYDSLQL